MAYIFLLFLFSPACATSLRAVGNVAIVARSTALLHTPHTPVFIHATHLSCGAEILGEVMKIKGGQFTKEESTRAPFEAKINGNKAVLEIGKAPLHSAGMYKCEVLTSTGEVATGNLAIYLSPVIEFDHEVDQDVTSEPHTILLKKRNLKTGDALILECSSFGYPQPFVRWEKNGRPLDGDVEYDGHSITINNVQPSHSAVYSCHAENSFPLFVGGPSMPHQTILRIPIHIE